MKQNKMFSSTVHSLQNVLCSCSSLWTTSWDHSKESCNPTDVYSVWMLPSWHHI